MWRRHLIAAVIFAFVPSIIVTWAIMRFVNLEKYKQSVFGQYLGHYMTRQMQAMCLVGFAVMAGGAWYHLVGLILLGLLVILFGWLRGVLFPQNHPSD